MADWLIQNVVHIAYVRMVWVATCAEMLMQTIAQIGQPTYFPSAQVATRIVASISSSAQPQVCTWLLTVRHQKN
uniref:Secreted protein n=1 Tax=Romanomermis culicivorax TaxID=13658 RepID=A0A915KZW8_ROMCU